MRIRHEQACVSVRDDYDPDSKKQRSVFRSPILVVRASFLFPALAAIAFLVLGLFLISKFVIAPKKRTRATKISTQNLLSEARTGLNTWARGEGLPTFGLTEGEYLDNGKFCFHCGNQTHWCTGKKSSTTRPPPELLAPGRLAPRSLSETAECFLWYAKELYTRPAGGPRGFWAQRIGGEVDNRIVLLDALHRYELHHGCLQFQASAPTPHAASISHFASAYS